jgi:hypothetical protein
MSRAWKIKEGMAVFPVKIPRFVPWEAGRFLNIAPIAEYEFRTPTSPESSILNDTHSIREHTPRDGGKSRETGGSI